MARAVARQARRLDCGSAEHGLTKRRAGGESCDWDKDIKRKLSDSQWKALITDGFNLKMS